MKRYVRSDEYLITIDVYYTIETNPTSIAAAAYSNPITDENGYIINESEYAEYQLFLENIELILDYYDLDVREESKSRSQVDKRNLKVKFQSSYYWIATAKQVESNNVPSYLRLRISDHYQEFSQQGKKLAKQKEDNFADSIKKPSTKRKQRYELANISVNSDKFNNYGDALLDVERLIREWLRNKGVDLTEYESIIDD